MSTHDAVVVGGGPNGLVAANRLADAGWSVLLLEEQPAVGGAVRSDEEVHPGFVHDTFSAFHPLAAASRAVLDLGLEEYGLRWLHGPAVLGHPRPDGRWHLLHRDRELTAAGFEAEHAGEGSAWLELCSLWDRIGGSMVDALTTPFPPLRHGSAALAKILRVGGLDLVRSLLLPIVDFGHDRFASEGPTLLMAGNAGHSDIPADAPGSGVFGLLMTMLGQTVGYPVPQGGAAALSRALSDRLLAAGGEVQCGARVTHVEVRDGQAVAVRTQDGGRHAADRAILAAVAAPVLYGQLLADAVVPRATSRAKRSFQLDPSTVKVDWALDGEVPWAQRPAAQPGTIHVADSLTEMAVFQAQVKTGAVPARPFMLAGQMTTCDPSRSPPGTESLWAYTHVPQHTVEDAGGEGIRGTWDKSDRERFADRMQARLETLAPGFGSRVLARRVLGPREMESRNRSLVGGAINGGTSQINQELFLRPVPGSGRAGTRIPGLFLASSSAHPGGGVHGSPGMNAARAALTRDRLRFGRSQRGVG